MSPLSDEKRSSNTPLSRGVHYDCGLGARCSGGIFIKLSGGVTFSSHRGKSGARKIIKGRGEGTEGGLTFR